MKKTRPKWIQRSDILLAAALVAISLLGLLFLPGGGAIVVVKHGDQVVYRGALDTDHRLLVTGTYQNEIVIENGKAYFAHSTCPHHECEKMGSVSRLGGTAACAPNHTILYVLGESEVDAVVK